VSRLAAPYVPRRPDESVLFALVKEHLEDFLRYARESYAGPLPRYVVDEFRAYLECGDFSRGFVHVQCSSCGDAMAVAFSCKLRGLCPSCTGRRMAGSAAHLVDRILPAVPTRQYVLAFPYELSGLAATRPDVLAALSRFFWESVRRHYQRWAKAAGLAASTVETGAVTGVHRAGASLNVHVHFHLLCLDGGYFEDTEGELHFEPAPAPTRADLAALLEHVHARVMRWLRRRGLLSDADAADASNAPRDVSMAEAMATAGMQRGTLVTVRDNGDGSDEDDVALAAPLPRVTDAVTHERFNLHASVHIGASDDVGRERLCRYLNRPAFSLARLRVRRDGSVTYRVKKASRRRVTERVMTPVETLARLAAIVPPPRYPLLRFHGLLAPRHRWRARVVPKPPERSTKSAPCKRRDAERGQTPASSAPPERPSVGEVGDGRSAFLPETANVSTSSLLRSGAATVVAPHVLSLAHWNRILDGELYATSARLDWRTLLKRTFEYDLRVCVRCGGRLVVRAAVTDPHSIRKLLDALRRPRAPPRSA
jgi:hypothetical protein